MSKDIQITKGRKFDQVVEGARKVFLRDGFEGASVDDIAREAGVSKATLYSYFPDKRLMFMEIFRSEISRETTNARALVDVDLPVTQVLPFIAQMIAAHLVSEFGVRIFRLAIGEAERFPTLAREYYENGVMLLHGQLADYFRKCVEKGELMMDDVALATDQFIELCSVSIHDRACLLGPDSVDEKQSQRVCDGAVRMFLQAYGTEGNRAASF